MKKYSFLILFIFCFSVPALAQSEVITVFDCVKIKNEKRAEALFYYENNWKVLREKAFAKGYIHSYELIETKADDKADFDIVLITRYTDQAQFEKSEENFQELIQQKGGLKLLNDLKPNEFRESVLAKVGKSHSNFEDRSVSENATTENCDSTELKTFDFLLGNWKQKDSSGKMHITKMLDGCGIQELWQLGEFNAILLRNYDNATKKWYLVFTANDLIPQVWEGRRENGNWIFYRNWELNGKKRRSRTFWTKDSDKGFTKIVEQLNDDGKTWRLHDKAEFETENIKISSAREQTITLENDGWKIVGDLLIPKSESPVPAVILLNKANGDRKVYENLAKHLAEKGIASFRVDLRAHGESINKGKFGPPFDEKMRSLLVGSDRDVTNAFNYLKAKPEIDAKRIGFVGGSYSGEQMVVAARNSGEYGKAYVALSPGSFSDESIESIDEKQIPFFFIKSVVELPFFKELFLAIREKSKTAQILEVSGDKHATEILEEHPELVEIIAVWFKAKL